MITKAMGLVGGSLAGLSSVHGTWACCGEIRRPQPLASRRKRILPIMDEQFKAWDNYLHSRGYPLEIQWEFTMQMIDP